MRGLFWLLLVTLAVLFWWLGGAFGQIGCESPTFLMAEPDSPVTPGIEVLILLPRGGPWLHQTVFASEVRCAEAYALLTSTLAHIPTDARVTVTRRGDCWAGSRDR